MHIADVLWSLLWNVCNLKNQPVIVALKVLSEKINKVVII